MKNFPFIVIYGAPNLGKTYQAELLAQKLNGNYIKYPVYDLKDTGPMINSIIREGVEATPLELQTLYAENRRCFEPILKIALEDRIVVGEAYIGTGVAHGMLEGVPKEVLEELNRDLLLPDLSILLDGERFVSGIEREHRFESKGADWEKTRGLHLELSQEYSWEMVNANQNRERVHEDILQIVNSWYPKT